MEVPGSEGNLRGGKVAEAWEIADIAALREQVHHRCVLHLTLPGAGASHPPRPLPDGNGSPCGLWVATAEVDWVFHQVATSPLHQEHIILHELAHMIFDHEIVRARPETLRTRLLPNLDPRVVAAVLARGQYSDEQEQEAEMLAGLIGTHARRAAPPLDGDPTFARAMDVFGPPT